MTFRPRKRFGQHWLHHEPTLRAIVAAADIQGNDRLWEIGPGMGVLTKQLLATESPVLAVELDRDLCVKLRKKLGQRPNFLLLEGDVLKLNFPELLKDFSDFWPPNKVVANIPYNITSPILELLLGTIAEPRSSRDSLANTSGLETIVLLVQKEIAERLTAQPRTKAYGALSVRMQYLARIDWIVDVPPKAFTPPPKVDSAVIRLTPYGEDNLPGDRLLLDKIVRLGFASRRKMLRNNLKGVIPPEELAPLLEQLALPATARAEDLGVEQWLILTDFLKNYFSNLTADH